MGSQFGEVDTAALTAKYQQMAEEKNRNFEGNWLQLKTGPNKIRLLPPKSQGAPFSVEANYHYKVGPLKKTVVCLKTLNQFCPVCAVAQTLRKEGSASAVAQAKELTSRRRYFFNVIDRADGKPKILGMSHTLATDILAFVVNPEWKNEDHAPLLTSPTNGVDITITKSGQGIDTEYQLIPGQSRTAIGGSPQEIEAILSGMADLTKIVVYNTPEELEKILLGQPLQATTATDAASAVAGTTPAVATPPPSVTTTPPPPVAKETTVTPPPPDGVDAQSAEAKAAVAAAFARLKGGG